MALTKKIALLAVTVFFTLSAFAATSKEVSYPSGDETIHGYLFTPSGNGPFPALMVIHEWWGLNDWVKEQASKLADEGYVTEDEAKAAAIDPNASIATTVQGSESYVADWVEGLVTSYIGDIKQDVVVQTTIDWNLQKAAEFDVREMVAKNGKARHFSQGALVAMTPDGLVRAMVGGADYEQSQYNRAITAKRQTGSAFKPMVYLTALEHGYTPETIVTDAPVTYNGWSPQNGGFGVLKSETGLTAAIEAAMKAIKADGTLAAIAEHYGQPSVIIDKVGVNTPTDGEM